MALVKRNHAVIWSDAQNGKFGGMLPLSVNYSGGGDGTKPGPGRDSVFVKDANRNAILGIAAETPPGGLPNKTLNFWEEYAVNHIRKAASEGRRITVQDRLHRYGALDNPTAWNKIFHYGLGVPGDFTLPGAQIEYDGTQMPSNVPVNFETFVEYLKPSLSAQDPPDTVVNANDVVFVSDLFPDIVAYPGPDKIGFVALDAVGAATAKLLATSDGGSTWENCDADPFGTDEHIAAVAYRVISPETGIRVIVANGSAAQIAYADVNWSDPTATTWTTVSTTGTPTALAWGTYNELLVATGSGVYISEDAGESIDRQLSSDANITGIEYVEWPQLGDAKYLMFGASNTILEKLVGSDTVTTLSGPSGGGAFGALAQAIDGTIWAGNGQSIYRSSDEGDTAAGWTQVKDFGASMAVSGIGLANGDPYILQVAVDNTTPGTGEVWISVDGKTFQQITALTNDGYNAAYQSPHNPNLFIIVGDDDTAQPVIQKLAP